MSIKKMSIKKMSIKKMSIFKKAAVAILMASSFLSPAHAGDDKSKSGEGIICLVALNNGQPAMMTVNWYMDGGLVTQKHSHVMRDVEPGTHVIRVRIGGESTSRTVTLIKGGSVNAVFEISGLLNKGVKK